jgi:hypothetical protein
MHRPHCHESIHNVFSDLHARLLMPANNVCQQRDQFSLHLTCIDAAQAQQQQ